MPADRSVSIAGLRWRPLLLAALLGLAPWLAQAQPGENGASGPSWNSLSASQRSVLAPLGKDWNQLPAENRAKWMEVASRFPRMSPEQQQRIQERMGEWSRMSPQQRNAARQNYQQSKQLPASDRQAGWQAYQALPSDQREALAARAQPGQSQAPQPLTGTRALRAAPVDAAVPKSNIVNPRPRGPGPQAVSPSTVQGSAGATTSLVNRSPTPPAHQQVGRPKIEARPDQVDRTTLLPKRRESASSSPQGRRGNGGSGSGGSGNAQ